MQSEQERLADKSHELLSLARMRWQTSSRHSFKARVRDLIGQCVPCTGVFSPLLKLKMWGLRRFIHREPPFEAQYGQDVIAINFVTDPQSSVFLDIGAYDGKSLSNTVVLERGLAWTGVCVEPNPHMHRQLKECRNCISVCCALSNAASHGLTFVVVEGEGGMLSHLKGTDTSGEKMHRIRELESIGKCTMKEINVPAKTILDLIAQTKIEQFHFVSIDTEGHELAIAQTIDFVQIGTEVISIEGNENEKAIHRLLTKQGFRLVCVAGDDLIYQSRRVRQNH